MVDVFACFHTVLGRAGSVPGVRVAPFLSNDIVWYSSVLSRTIGSRRSSQTQVRIIKLKVLNLTVNAFCVSSLRHSQGNALRVYSEVSELR